MQMVVVKGSGGGGLGDAIRSVLVGVLYAKITGRAIHVDWSHGLFGQKGENVFHRFFKLIDVNYEYSLPESYTVCPISWEGRLQKSLDEVYRDDGSPPWDRQAAIEKYSSDLSVIDYPQSVVVLWDFDQLVKLKERSGYPARSLNDLYVYIIRHHLRLDTSIEEEVYHFWQTINSEDVIGIHIRMTDEFDKNKGSVPLEDYVIELKKLVRRNPRMPIFLATDNIGCQEYILSKFDNVYIREKWFPSAGEAIHLSDDGRDKYTLTKDALIEMVLLSKCKFLIHHASSSFSVVARYMGGAENKNSICLPRRSRYRHLVGKVLSLIGG